MPETSHNAPVQCAAPGCTEEHKMDRWGATRAQSAGWFMQRSGDVWCPQHVPEWVDSWRASKKTDREKDEAHG